MRLDRDNRTDWFITVLTAMTILLLLLLYQPTTRAQNVIRQGNTFVEISKTKKDSAQRTIYTYKDRHGKLYPIYLSAKGKAFIIRTSKNGKEYRQYLKDIKLKS
jgi:hypothetical protein